MVWSRGTGGMGDKTREEVFKKLNHALSLLQQKLSKIAQFAVLTLIFPLILKYHLIILNIVILNIIPSSSSCCFACIKEVSQVLFLYKQVGTEGGMYKAFYKQFIKKVILMQDYL